MTPLFWVMFFFFKVYFWVQTWENTANISSIRSRGSKSKSGSSDIELWLARHKGYPCFKRFAKQEREVSTPMGPRGPKPAPGPTPPQAARTGGAGWVFLSFPWADVPFVSLERAGQGVPSKEDAPANHQGYLTLCSQSCGNLEDFSTNPSLTVRTRDLEPVCFNHGPRQRRQSWRSSCWFVA